jgi:hypothetical protein
MAQQWILYFNQSEYLNMDSCTTGEGVLSSQTEIHENQEEK